MWLLLIVLLLLGGGVAAAESTDTSQPAPTPAPDDGTVLGCPAFAACLGGNLDAIEISAFAEGAGFAGADLITAVAIALAESGGNPGPPDGDQALAPTNGPSKGLWQINTGSKAHPEYRNVNLYDPATNAAAAFNIYSAAGGFRPWSTFTSGKFRAHLSAAQDAVNA